MQNAVKLDFDNKRLICEGEWNLSSVAELEFSLKAFRWPTEGELHIDGHAITKMDSAGAWLLSTWLKKVIPQNVKVSLENFSKQHQTLLSLVQARITPSTAIPKPKKTGYLERIGRNTVLQVDELRDFLAFTGKLSIEGVRIISQPSLIRWRELAGIIEKTGSNALPIIALLSFMIGVVLTYQMGVQLRNYGANVFIVDLLGQSIFREFGPLITAIMVAGRTGSAFTAELGIMKINQEIDALDTLGVTPGELLLLPRIMGLVIALPLLTMWANMFGIFGGMVMSNNMLGITWYDFLHRFQAVIPLKALLIGLGKTPIFALIISGVGCFEGMRVEGSADSIGRNTTRSVVLGIFFIIVADAIFSILFSRLNL